MANDTTDSTAASPSDTVDEFPGYPGFKLGDPVPGQPGTNIGDPIFDDAGNRWNWRKGEWEYVNLAQPPSSDKGGVKPVDGTLTSDTYNPSSPISGGVTGAGTPPTTIKLEDGTVVTSGGTGLVGFPGRLPIVLPGSSVTSTPILDLSQPPVAPVAPVTPPKPPKPITIPGSSVTSTPSIVEPTTVPIPARRMQEALNPYNGYINYDPDEILAAAMRVMNGRMAGRSMLNDLRR
jgi:hypothetical protein